MIKRHISLRTCLDNWTALWDVAGMKVLATACWPWLAGWRGRRWGEAGRSWLWRYDWDTLCAPSIFSTLYSWLKNHIRKSPEIFRISSQGPCPSTTTTWHWSLEMFSIKQKCSLMPLPVQGHYSKFSSLANLKGTKTSPLASKM